MAYFQTVPPGTFEAYAYEHRYTSTEGEWISEFEASISRGKEASHAVTLVREPASLEPEKDKSREVTLGAPEAMDDSREDWFSFEDAIDDTISEADPVEAEPLEIEHDFTIEEGEEITVPENLLEDN